MFTLEILKLHAIFETMSAAIPNVTHNLFSAETIDAIRKEVGHATWAPIKISAYGTAGSCSMSEASDISYWAWYRTSDEAGGRVKNVINKYSGDNATMATETARVLLKDVISRESAICGKIEAKFPLVDVRCAHVMETLMDRLIHKKNLFDKMNFGGRCWYLWRLWKVMEAGGLTKDESLREKYNELVGKNGTPTRNFIETVKEPEYGRKEFLAAAKNVDLLPDLLPEIYEYVKGLSDDQVYKELVSLI